MRVMIWMNSRRGNYRLISTLINWGVFFFSFLRYANTSVTASWFSLKKNSPEDNWKSLGILYMIKTVLFLFFFLLHNNIVDVLICYIKCHIFFLKKRLTDVIKEGEISVAEKLPVFCLHINYQCGMQEFGCSYAFQGC